MKHFIDIKDDAMYGFEMDGQSDHLITETMVQLTDEQYETFRNRPSDFHHFSSKTMSWEISKEKQIELNEESERIKVEMVKLEIASLRTQCDKDILPLQDAVDLDEATQEERDKLIALKRYRIALNRWEYPAPIPVPI